jgi:hypothetical protein
MNKRALFVCLAAALLAIPATSSAQVSGGIKAGINIANVNGFNDPGTDPSQRTALTGGVFMTFGVTPVIAIQPEVLFSMQGSKLHFTNGTVQSDATAKIDYIQVPIQLRIGNSARDKASFYALAGPTIGILVRADQEGVDFKDDLKRAQIGLTGSVGVTLTRFLIEARYTQDLNDFNKASTGTSQKNRVASFLIGFVF